MCDDLNISPEWEKKAQPYPVARGEQHDYVLDYLCMAEEVYIDDFIADNLDKITRTAVKGTVAATATIPRPLEVLHSRFQEPD